MKTLRINFKDMFKDLNPCKGFINIFFLISIGYVKYPGEIHAFEYDIRG